MELISSIKNPRGFRVPSCCVDCPIPLRSESDPPDCLRQVPSAGFRTQRVGVQVVQEIFRKVRNQFKSVNHFHVRVTSGNCFHIFAETDQHGNLFHPYDVYLNASIFSHTPTDTPALITKIAAAVAKDHPQVAEQVIVEHIMKMAEQRQIKWASEPGPEGQVIQYKADIAFRWNRYQDMHFLEQFADYAGKKITLSPEDIEAEFERANQDRRDLWGKGHLYRESKKRSETEHEQMNLIKWAYANNENWGWYHLMSVMQVKLEMMVEYMRHWSHIANGPVYADQMERVISLMKVILDWGGESEYKHTEDDYLDAKHFSRYVNFKNRKLFPSPDYNGHHFWCKAQRLRFDKAWNLLWEMFRTKLLTWDD